MRYSCSSRWSQLFVHAHFFCTQRREQPICSAPEEFESPPVRGGATGTRTLVVVWSASEPDRVGEVLFLPKGRSVLGRYDSEEPPSDEPFLLPVRQRPGRNEDAPPLDLPLHVSRRQIEVIRGSSGPLTLIRVGKAAVVLNGSRELSP